MKKHLAAIAIILSLVTSGIVLPLQIPDRHTPIIQYAEANNLGASLLGGAGACALLTLILQGLSSLSSVLNLKVPIVDPNTDMKEQFLDCLIYNVVNVMIEQMTDDIVDWIQRGFRGNPGFTINLGGLLTDIADEVLNEHINGDLSLLCEPIAPQVKIALINKYQKKKKEFECSITDIIENVEDFIEGDFEKGGWATWFEITQDSQNNQYGAFIEAEFEYLRALSAARGQELKKRDWARGFLSKEVCEQVPLYEPGEDPSGPFPPTYVEQCKTVTPGSTVENSLKEVLPAGFDRLKLADEVNEIINALIAFLMQSILTEAQGLLGYDKDDFDYELPELPDLPDIPGLPNPGAACDPNDAAGAASNTITRQYLTGSPWTPEGLGQGGSYRQNLGLSGHYSKMFLSFDFKLEEIDPNSQFQILFAVLNENRGNTGASCFIELFAQDNGAILNLCENALGEGWINQRNGVNWEPGKWYHFTISYDATGGVALATMNRGKGGGGGQVFSLSGEIVSSIYPVGNGTMLQLAGGDPNPAANVFPLHGSLFENVEITLIPGDGPVCRADGLGGFFDSDDPDVDIDE